MDDLKSGAFTRRQVTRDELANGIFYPITTHTEAEWQYFAHKFNTNELFDYEGGRVIVLEMHRHSPTIEGSVTLWAPMQTSQAKP